VGKPLEKLPLKEGGHWKQPQRLHVSGSPERKYLNGAIVAIVNERKINKKFWEELITYFP
jgi:hypothetical protein